MYSSSCNHGSGKWVPPRWVSFKLGQFSTSIILGERVLYSCRILWMNVHHRKITLLQIPKNSCKLLFIKGHKSLSPPINGHSAGDPCPTKATCCKSTNKGGAGAGGGFSTYAGNSNMNHETLGKTVLKFFSFKMQCQIPEDWRMIWSKCQFWTQISISACDSLHFTEQKFDK